MSDPLEVLRHRCPHLYGEPCDCPDKGAALDTLVARVEEAEARADRLAEALREIADTGARSSRTLPMAKIARDALARAEAHDE